MDLMSLVRLMARHWRVTGPAAAATLLLVVGVFVLSSPTYAASASVALYSPPEAPDAGETPGANPSAGQNPFTRYGDLSVVADIVARRMDSDAERAALKSKGVTDYDVVANRLQRGPLIEVTGTGSNPAVAISSAEAVVAEFDSVLLEMQEAEGADPDYFITSGPIEPPEKAVAQVGSTLRTAIAALVVGALGTVALAVAAEAFTRRRAAAPSTTAVPGSTPEVATGPAQESEGDHPTPPLAGGRFGLRPVDDQAGDHPTPPLAGGRFGVRPVDDQAGDHPTPPFAGGRFGVRPVDDRADEHPRSPTSLGRSATKAPGPVDDHPQQSSGGGRPAPPKWGDPGAVARAESPNGSHRRAQRAASVPAADRPEGKQKDPALWLTSFAPENGHEKPTTDRST
jgi:hypothetical protein